ncbi:MAG TPA: hypothetical protein VHD56_16020 [Tepidisphaeraceae bacterium]|nr:hypothetical protein [Tepidisphaeraceae bacterium]
MLLDVSRRVLFAVVSTAIVSTVIAAGPTTSTSQPSDEERQIQLMKYFDLKDQVVLLRNRAYRLDPSLSNAVLVKGLAEEDNKKHLPNFKNALSYLRSLPDEQQLAQRGAFFKIQTLQELLTLSEMFSDSIQSQLLKRTLDVNSADFKNTWAIAGESVTQLKGAHIENIDSLSKVLASNRAVITAKRDEIIVSSNLPENVVEAAKNEPVTRSHLTAASKYLMQFTPIELKQREADLDKMGRQLGIPAPTRPSTNPNLKTGG